jgi:hypothetical protein
MGSALSSGTPDPYLIATITLAGVAGILGITLVTVWCCCCRLQRQLSVGSTSYAASQYVAKEAPVMRESYHWGEAPHGGVHPSAHPGPSAYDLMAHGQHQEMAMPAPQHTSPNLYLPSPEPSCGPKKEFERVLLNPASTACTKPPPAPGPASLPSCDNSCSAAQFVLQSAARPY